VCPIGLDAIRVVRQLLVEGQNRHTSASGWHPNRAWPKATNGTFAAMGFVSRGTKIANDIALTTFLRAIGLGRRLYRRTSAAAA
jgi:hypothetical protein